MFTHTIIHKSIKKCAHGFDAVLGTMKSTIQQMVALLSLTELTPYMEKPVRIRNNGTKLEMIKL